MSKLLFFDLETTGVKFWRNGIHQIGGIVDIDGQETERFDIRLAPNPAATIEHEALDVAGVPWSRYSRINLWKKGTGS